MRTIRLLVPITLLACAVAGAAPVARVVSVGLVDVDGISVLPGNYFPASIGSDVRAQASPVVVQFSDGTVLTMTPHSRVKIEGLPGSPTIRVIQGVAQYAPSSAAKVHISSLPGASVKTLTARNVDAGGRIIPTTTFSASGSSSSDATSFLITATPALVPLRASDEVPGSSTITLTYGGLPPGVSTVPGPPPVSTTTPAVSSTAP